MWAGKRIQDVGVPHNTLIAIIMRGKETIVPRGDVTILPGDKLILCAEPASDGVLEHVREVVLRKNHPWNGQRIMDLDISRQTFVVMVDRAGKMMIPTGDLELCEGDRVLVFTKENINKYLREAY